MQFIHQTLHGIHAAANTSSITHPYEVFKTVPTRQTHL
jgi:hypothetical protein